MPIPILSAARCVAPLFRIPFLKRAVAGSHSRFLSEVLANDAVAALYPDRSSLKSLLNDLYQFLLAHYRCEYVYKNSVATSLFLKGHNPKDAYLTSEFRSAQSRADVVILNGTSTIYEIKTEYDSLEKLQTQLVDYRKVFDRICIVVPPSRIRSAMNAVDRDTGILVMDQRLQVETFREPTSNRSNTSPSEIFDCLRRSEYENCIRDSFGYAPEVPSGRRHSVYKEMFKTFSSEMAHDLMVKHVKRRSNFQRLSRLLSEVPVSLSHLCLTLDESGAFIEKLRLVLNCEVESI